MAERTQGSITIDADPDAILDAISDFEAYPEWAGEIKKVEIREKAPDGRAKQVYFEVSAGPINAKYTLEYTYGDAGVSWTFVEGSPIRNLEGEYVLSPDGERTDVTYKVTIDPGIPMIGFMKKQAERKIIDTALKGLKKRVESR